MEKDYSISVILPVYNEEDNIERVIEDSADFLVTQDRFKEYEIITIDDGSKDNTAKVLKKLANRIPYLKVIIHHKNLGYGKALMSGLRESKYSLIFFMDGDGQFRFDSIKETLNYILNYDIIMGHRYKREDPFYRIVLGRIYSFLVFLLFGLNFKDINCGFKLFKKEAIEDDYNLNGGLFYTEVLLKAKIKGLRIKEIPIRHFPRLNGKQTGASPKVILKAMIDIIKLVVTQK